MRHWNSNHWIWLLLAGCVLTFAGCSKQKIPTVEKLSLRDPRLSLDARRWLADAEDEVVIALAGLEMAEARVNRVETYKDMIGDEKVFLPGPGNKGNVSQLEDSLDTYVEAQLMLEEAQLVAAKIGLELARARLTQVRAETAIRFDLAVYPMAPIVEQVETLKKELGAASSGLEDLRVKVETQAAQLWKNYANFVKQGGVTRNFWKVRSL
ncbi:MAG: hypothetical protein JXR76_23135 [Deltaproteobacteria bacterium]|nr:hypothetical protein [Deltaproteobacteria bacterium]